MAIGNRLVAVILIEDPIRKESGQLIHSLHESGLHNLVMMTGDSERTAKAVASKVGMDAYYSEVLPEDKATFVRKEKSNLSTKLENRIEGNYHKIMTINSTLIALGILGILPPSSTAYLHNLSTLALSVYSMSDIKM